MYMCMYNWITFCIPENNTSLLINYNSINQKLETKLPKMDIYPVVKLEHVQKDSLIRLSGNMGLDLIKDLWSLNTNKMHVELTHRMCLFL